MSIIEIKAPDIGGHENVDIIVVEVKIGDTTAVDDTLIMLETDKATMDVPADAAGVVKEAKARVGDKISEGGVILAAEIGTAVADAAPVPAAETPAAPVAASAVAPVGGATVQVVVLNIGGHSDVDAIAVEIKVGDTVAVDDTLITLETDKATMDAPCTEAGVVKAVSLKVGDKVSEGSAIIEVETAGSVAAALAPATQAAAPAPATAPAPAAPVATPAPAAPAAVKIGEAAFAKAHAGPFARRLACELGVDLGQVKGTGLEDCIMGEDVRASVKPAMQSGAGKPTAISLGGGPDLLPWPKVDLSKFDSVEVKELSRIKKIFGQNLSRNWVAIPHVTIHEEVDMTELEEFRKQLNKKWKREGVKLSPLAFIIKVSVAALKAFLEFNASLDGDNLVLKNYFNIGFAADTPNGLVVPMIKDMGQEGLRQTSQELTELSEKAREGKLKPQEMQGARFTISSLDGIGGTDFTPIVNASEVAILGVCKSQIKPVWNGKELAPRLMCPLSLPFSHRVIDGVAGIRFTVFLANLLKDFRHITL